MFAVQTSGWWKVHLCRLFAPVFHVSLDGGHSLGFGCGLDFADFCRIGWGSSQQWGEAGGGAAAARGRAEETWGVGGGHSGRSGRGRAGTRGGRGRMKSGETWKKRFFRETSIRTHLVRLQRLVFGAPYGALVRWDIRSVFSQGRRGKKEDFRWAVTDDCNVTLGRMWFYGERGNCQQRLTCEGPLFNIIDRCLVASINAGMVGGAWALHGLIEGSS